MQEHPHQTSTEESLAPETMGWHSGRPGDAEAAARQEFCLEENMFGTRIAHSLLTIKKYIKKKERLKGIVKLSSGAKSRFVCVCIIFGTRRV